MTVLRGRKMLMLVAAGALLTTAPLARSEEKPAPTVRFEEPDTMASALKRLEGRAVKIRLAGQGEEISGKLQKVGKELVHVSDLAGREFYDAIIRIDQISAVVAQSRAR